VLVDSSFFIGRLRAGSDPLIDLAAHSDDWELLTCGVVQIEVLRGMKQKKGASAHGGLHGLHAPCPYA
jgi:predicted nucleic acid-binding protein